MQKQKRRSGLATRAPTYESEDGNEWTDDDDGGGVSSRHGGSSAAPLRLPGRACLEGRKAALPDGTAEVRGVLVRALRR